MVAAIKGPGGGQLLQGALADNLLRLGLGGAWRRQQQGSQDPDNSDHHQQFEEREGFPAKLLLRLFMKAMSIPVSGF